MQRKADQAVRIDRHGEVLAVVIDHPPGNALTAGVVQGLVDALDAAEADETLRAVVIRGAGPGFSVGAEPGELLVPPGALCRRIEDFPKPIIAALHGVVLGEALELAMAAHLRLALDGTRLGFPQVRLGLLPGAGGTQRLPRLVGAEQALRLLLEAEPVAAAEALAMGLVDRVVEEGLEAATLALAREALAHPPPSTRARRDGLRDPVAYQLAVAAVRHRLTGERLPAPERIADCVEAALLLPLDQGLAFEAAARADLVASPEAAGLAHAARAERRAAHLPEAAATPIPVRTVGLSGTGAATAQWARALLRAGITVTVAGDDRAGLVAVLEGVAAAQEAEVQGGTLSVEAREAEWARLKPALSESVLEGLDVVFALGQGPAVALLGQTALVLHLPDGGALAEVEVATGVPAQAVATLFGLLRRMGRTPLRCTGPGGIGAPVRAAGRGAAAYLVAQGVAADSVRAALDRFGCVGLAPEAGTGTGLPADRVIARCLGAMVNAAARLLARRAVLRPSDIDVAMILGQGFPRWEGGPMFWADRRGLLVLRRDLRVWAAEEGPGAPELWAPAPLFDELIRDGRPLSSLN